MTEEKIKKGEELLNSLSRLKDQRKRWQSAVKIKTIEVIDCDKRTTYVGECFINFEELKLLALAKIDRRIDAVQREFDEL